MSVITPTRKARCARNIVIAAIAAFGVADVAKAHAAGLATHGHEVQASAARGFARGRTLGGVTRQGGAVVVAVSSNQRRVALLVVVKMNCTSGDTFLIEAGWAGLQVHGNGFVRGQKTVPASPGSATSAAVTGGTQTIDGLFNRRHETFVGSADVHLNFTMPNGQTDSCDSGLASFAAVL